MAIEFARVRYVKRSDGGNACRTSAYNGRQDVRCERTGERFYFSHREPTLDHRVLLPEGASDRFLDTAELWNAAQAAEKRKDAQEARELLLALPSDPGLGLDDWRTLTEEFAREHFVSKGVAVQIDIHPPHEGDRNVHAHLLISTRRLEGDAFSAAKARDLDPEIRTGRNGRPVVAEGDAWGVLWREFQNRYFEREGLDIRVDETGIVPQRHEGPVRQRTTPDEALARAETVAAENAEAVRDPERLLTTLTRNRATFTELDIERHLKTHVANAEERAAIRQDVLAHESVVALHDRADGAFSGRFTTTTVRQQEQDVIASAASIVRARDAIGETHRAAASADRAFDDGQAAAFLKATGTDGLVVIEGLAGAGKSYSVEAIREAHERAGWRVIGLAPTNTVAEDLRRAGFTHGSTVHLELYYQESARHDRAAAWDRKTCVVVDEAAMLDTSVYARLMRHAAETEAKVILVGDDRQLASIERGGMFSELKARHGSAVIGKVRRQEEDWQRAASADFAAGRVPEGLRAYAQHDNVHWSADLEESRTRLLSDWDQYSRARPGLNRFVYASTNAEVERLNADIRSIRQRRGEVGEGTAVETSRGRIEIGAGDRIQFFGNDRRAGIFNGTLGTVTAIAGTEIGVMTDTGKAVRFDAAEFDEFGLGYAGTVYRGQGKTQAEVYALYDSAFAWNARTAYVGMTRHRADVNLYVPRTLAADEVALGRQMSRRMRDEASLAYATAAEVTDLAAAREQRSEPKPTVIARTGAEEGRGAGFPREEAQALRQLDLAAYARDAHGFAVHPDPARPNHFKLTRRAGDREDRLEVRRAPDGHWTYRNPKDPRDRGDVLDFAKREGASDLATARRQVAAYRAGLEAADPPAETETKRSDEREKDQLAASRAARLAAVVKAARQRLAALGERLEAAFERFTARHGPPAPAAAPPERSADGDRAPVRQGAGENQQAAIGAAVAQAFAREEAERKARLDAETRRAQEAEFVRLKEMQQRRPLHHKAYTAQQGAIAEQARRETGIAGPETSLLRKFPPTGIGATVVPASARLRYAECLARHYDPRDPYASLARASLAESAGWMSERSELDLKIASEGDLTRREALMLRRQIEHDEHMAQAWGRIAGQCRAIGSQAHIGQAAKHELQAEGHQAGARKGRGLWEQCAIENPRLYRPLDEPMRTPVEAARRRLDNKDAKPAASAVRKRPQRRDILRVAQDHPDAASSIRWAAIARKSGTTGESNLQDDRETRKAYWRSKTPDKEANNPGKENVNERGQAQESSKDQDKEQTREGPEK